MRLFKDLRRRLSKVRVPFLCGLPVSKRHHPVPLKYKSNHGQNFRVIVEVWSRKRPKVVILSGLMLVARGLPLSEHHTRRYL
jgi:hypothetical protein